jgi:hypothetical protein
VNEFHRANGYTFMFYGKTELKKISRVPIGEVGPRYSSIIPIDVIIYNSDPLDFFYFKDSDPYGQDQMFKCSEFGRFGWTPEHSVTLCRTMID